MLTLAIRAPTNILWKRRMVSTSEVNQVHIQKQPVVGGRRDRIPCTFFDVDDKIDEDIEEVSEKIGLKWGMHALICSPVYDKFSGFRFNNLCNYKSMPPASSCQYSQGLDKGKN